VKERILEILKEKPQDIDSLVKMLNAQSSQDYTSLIKQVNQFVDEGYCFEVDGKYYFSTNYRSGIVHKNRDFYTVEADQDYILLNGLDMGVMEGDEIIFSLFKHKATGLKVTKRKTVYILGTMTKNRRGFYFFSDEYKFQDFKVVNQKEYQDKFKEHDRVRCYISNYKKQELKIDTIIGPEGKDETFVKTILLMNDAPKPFKEKLLKEAENLNPTISKENRKDFTDLPFITIDGPDAKDFDDAICVTRCEDGYILYVAIADVSYYVQEDSIIDKEAKARGTSIYYPGHVIPMLPEVLCNDLCSLKEKVARYTLTCQMHVDFTGEVIDYEIVPSVIQSRHRMTYPDVNLILEHDKELTNKYSDICPMIYAAYELSRIVDKNRKDKGGIEFESNEPIIIEEKGKVVDIQIRQQGKAELLIEDFMILANQTVAVHMFYLNNPMVYRNHDYPKTDRLEKFVRFVESLDYHFKNNIAGLKSSVLQKCLNSFESRVEYSLVSDMLLRSMSKAIYESTCYGHYGLGLEHYCHFTSPIRRYPDLLVHRMLKKYVFDTNNTKDIDKDNEMINTLTKLCNDNEKKATMIERQIVDLKCCEYMQDKIGMVFDGIICSVVGYGFYVQLENTIEGLVHVKTLDGIFDLQDDVLTDGNISYQAGQKVKVRLIKVDLNKRNIDFEIVRKKSTRTKIYFD